MIRLERMSERDFATYTERWIVEFAKNSLRHRDWKPADAVADVRRDFFSNIMPQGFKTPGHFLFILFECDEGGDGDGANARKGGTRVGALHLGEAKTPNPQVLHAWNFEIDEPFRGRGLAKKAMLEAARVLKELGYQRVTLNVFGTNTVARGLYESMGFAVTSVQMARDL